MVAIDLEWREMYIGIVLGSGLRGDEDRKESYMLSWDCWELCYGKHYLFGDIEGIVRMYDIDVEIVILNEIEMDE